MCCLTRVYYNTHHNQRWRWQRQRRRRQQQREKSWVVVRVMAIEMETIRRYYPHILSTKNKQTTTTATLNIAQWMLLLGWRERENERMPFQTRNSINCFNKKLKLSNITTKTLYIQMWISLSLSHTLCLALTHFVNGENRRIVMNIVIDSNFESQNELKHLCDFDFISQTEQRLKR